MFGSVVGSVGWETVSRERARCDAWWQVGHETTPVTVLRWPDPAVSLVVPPAAQVVSARPIHVDHAPTLAMR